MGYDALLSSCVRVLLAVCVALVLPGTGSTSELDSEAQTPSRRAPGRVAATVSGAVK